MALCSILGCSTSTDVALAPFAHLARAQALPGDLYSRLADAFPEAAQILGGRSDFRGNAAARLPAMKVLGNPAIDPVWREFFAVHTSNQFWQDICRVFGPALRAAFPGLEGRIGLPMAEWRAGPRGRAGPGEIRLDCQFVVNTPAQRTSSVKTPHVDKCDTIFSALLYFRDPQDLAEGGALDLYAWKVAPRFLRHRMILPQDVEARHRLDYAANSLACFVNSAQAAHGVSPRGPACHPRRYVNFIAEMPFAAFALPPVRWPARLANWRQVRQVGRRSVGGDRY